MIFVVPIELTKVQKQGKNTKNKSYGEIVKELTKKKGLLGIYRGFWGSFWSLVPRSGTYFYAYQKFQDMFANFDNEKENRKRHRVLLDKIFAGGFAGMSGWALTYPFDVIKSYVQYDPDHKSLIKTTKYLYKENGFGYFYRGLNVTMMRAFPVNAVAFAVHDIVNKLLKEF